MRRACARLDVAGQTIDLHYRVAGSGPALFLLHPSPLSSDFMRPLMTRLAPHATLIAPDTPGFGWSSALSNPAGTLEIYVEAIVALAGKLGLSRYAAYGSATGAQIAIELAKVDAGRVSGIVADNAAAFTDEQLARICDGYFPDMTPHEDGRHLATIWRVAHDGTRYFPWQQPRPDNEIGAGFALPAAMNATALGYLTAGPGYEVPYRAAFANERAERLQAVQVPAVVLRWAGSILRRYTDQLDNFEWGPNVHMMSSEADLESRWESLEASLALVLPGEDTSADELERQDGKLRFLDTAIGQIAVRVPDGKAEALQIHGLGGASDLLPPEPGIVRMDLPGHGASAHLQADIEGCQRAVAAVAQSLGLRELAAWSPKAQLAPPDLEPQAGGGHLLEGWHWLRRNELTNESIQPPEQRTRALAALLRSASAHHRLHGAQNKP